MTPAKLWWASTRMHARGWPRVARALAVLNYYVFHVDLPPEAVIARDLKLFHRGIGVVVNGNVQIGSGVRIVHGVTIGIAAGDGRERPGRIVIEDDVRIGANAVIMGREGRTLTIGEGASIGALAYVREDVPRRSKVYAPMAVIGTAPPDKPRATI